MDRYLGKHTNQLIIPKQEGIFYSVSFCCMIIIRHTLRHAAPIFEKQDRYRCTYLLSVYVYVQLILNIFQEKTTTCVVHACITAVRERSGSRERKDVKF